MQQKSDHDQRARVRQFAVGDAVAMKNFRPGPDWIPGTVVSKLGPSSYLIETTDKQLSRRHVDHLKSRVIDRETSSIIVSQPVEDDQEDAGFEHGTPSSDPLQCTEAAVTPPLQSEDSPAEPNNDRDTSTALRTSSDSSHTEPQTKPYPHRLHRGPPDYYRPGT